MEKNFRDWKFRGWARNTSKCKFGVVGMDGFDYCTVFSKNFCDFTCSDCEKTELEMLNKGLNGIVLFYGADNTSYMIRYKQNQLAKNLIDLSEFDNKKLSMSLFYNS